MAINRYRGNGLVINEDSQYKELFRARGIDQVILVSFRICSLISCI